MEMREENLERPESTLSTTDVARYCRTSVVNVNRWIKIGKLQSYRYPAGRHKITKDNFRKFLEENNIPIVESFFEEKRLIKVLVGEDDQDFSKGLRESLTKKFPDFEIEVVEDGYEVLIKVGKMKPDLLILDIGLPTIDGLEVCHRIKNDEELGDVKILAITGHSEIYRKEDVLKAGADEYMRKPFKINELFNFIEKLLVIKQESNRR